MRLAEANVIANLRDEGLQQQRISKDIKLGIELARDIFAEAVERDQPFLYHTPESWARRWLPSKRFRLVRMPLNAAAMPCEPKIDNLVLKKIHAMETKPIIVDYNLRQVGKSMHGFVPQVIVIDGKHRFKAAALRGETYIMAWVGELAAEQMHALGGGGPAPERTTPAPGAKLNATSRQEMKQQTKNSVQFEGQVKLRNQPFAEAVKLKKLDVKKVSAGGPGSGRRPGQCYNCGQNKDVRYVGRRSGLNAYYCKSCEANPKAMDKVDQTKKEQGVSKPGEMGYKGWKQGSIL